MPKVSVVIPTLGDPTVHEAIRTARAQTIDTEIIVVEDGDAELDIDVDIHIASDTDSVGEARNQGADAATSRYIAFLDDDDRWAPEKCQRQVEFLETTGADVCVCGHTDSGGDHLPRITAPVEQLKQVSLGVPSSVLIRSEVIERHRWTDLPIWEEREWYSRVLAAEDVVALDAVLTCYDDAVDGSLSGSPELIVEYGIPMIRRRARALGEDPDEVVAWAYRRLSIIYHRDSRWRSLQYSLRALAKCPQWPMARAVIRSITGRYYHTIEKVVR